MFKKIVKSSVIAALATSALVQVTLMRRQKKIEKHLFNTLKQSLKIR
jgi:hypothetical protein